MENFSESDTYSVASTPLPELTFPKAGTCYSKVTGRLRIKGEWLRVTHSGIGYFSYEYLYPMEVGRVWVKRGFPLS